MRCQEGRKKPIYKPYPFLVWLEDIQRDVEADPRLAMIGEKLLQGEKVKQPYHLKLFKEFHNSRGGRHSGALRTYKILVANVYLMGMLKKKGGRSPSASHNHSLSGWLGGHLERGRDRPKASQDRGEIASRGEGEATLSSGGRETPKQWAKCVSWVEYLYNINFQGSTGKTPFQGVYGRAPPSPKNHLPGDFVVAAVAEELWNRDKVLRQLKYKLDRSKKRMTNSANKYFGSYQIIRRVRVVAYDLRLLDYAKIHLVFHVSLFEKVKGDHRVVVELPTELIWKEEESQIARRELVIESWFSGKARHKMRPL
ncbi:LOW QUALITY PROTEIN: hypothetical protein V2J09_023076 [Rumex salicifolius]